MSSETYNLISKGEILSGHTKSSVIARLCQLFNAEEKAIAGIFTNKPKVIVKNLSWVGVLKYKKKLNAIGLIIYPDVCLDSNIFRQSLIPVNKLAKDPEPDSNKSTPIWRFYKFDRKRINPMLVHPPYTETVFDEEEKPVFNLQSFNHVINLKFLLFISLFSGLAVQVYFSRLLVLYLPGTVVTFFSITLFVLAFVFIPKIMQPSRIFTLRKINRHKVYLLCAQEPGYNPFVDRYKIYSEKGEILANVIHNKLRYQYKCIATNGDILFSSSEEHNIDDFTVSATKDLRDELFNFGFLKYFELFGQWLKKVINWIKKRQQLYLREDSYIIRDGKLRIIAHFYRENISAIELPENNNSDEYKSLLAFTLLCVGVD